MIEDLYSICTVAIEIGSESDCRPIRTAKSRDRDFRFGCRSED